MKKLIYFTLAAVVIAAMYILYQNQLGAVFFFGLSIFFFVVAIKWISGRNEGEKKRSKE